MNTSAETATKICSTCQITYAVDKHFCRKCGMRLVLAKSLDPAVIQKRQTFETHIAQDPNDMEALAEYADYLLSLPLPDEILARLGKALETHTPDEILPALELDPTNPRTALYLGIAICQYAMRKDSGRLAETLEMLKKALAGAHNLPAEEINLGRLYLVSVRLLLEPVVSSELVALLDQVNSDYLDDIHRLLLAKDFILLGQSYLKDHQEDKAVKSYQTSLQVYDTAEVRKLLAEFYGGKGDAYASRNQHSQAIENYTVGLHYQPEENVWQTKLAQVCSKKARRARLRKCGVAALFLLVLTAVLAIYYAQLVAVERPEQPIPSDKPLVQVTKPPVPSDKPLSQDTKPSVPSDDKPLAENINPLKAEPNPLWQEASQYLEKREYEQALTCYAKLAGVSPDKLTEIEEKKLAIKAAMYSQTDALQKERQWEEAGKMYAQIAGSFPDEKDKVTAGLKDLGLQQANAMASVLLQKAREENTAGNLDAAMDFYREVAALYSQVPVAQESVAETEKIKAALQQKAKSCEDAKQWPQALAELEKVMLYFPSEENQAWQERLVNQRDSQEAESLYRESAALAKSKKYPEAMMRLHVVTEMYKSIAIVGKAQNMLAKVQKKLGNNNKELEALKMFQDGVKARTKDEYSLALETFQKLSEQFADTQTGRDIKEWIDKTSKDALKFREAQSMQLFQEGIKAINARQYQQAQEILRKVNDNFADTPAGHRSKDWLEKIAKEVQREQREAK